jgi:ferredoxin-NADP reductase
MATSAPAARPPGTGHHKEFHPLRVQRVVPETSDACSIVLDVPDDLAELFGYHAGQFCTFRVTLDGRELVRCYSMSSSPELGEPLQVTVKRVPDGAVSNWMNDALAAGDVIDVEPPSGFFRLREGDGDVVAFAAGSGITPIFSLIKSTLAATSRRIRLLYANRDRESVIFDRSLDSLVARYPHQLSVVHHLDVESGFVGAEAVSEMLGGASDPEYLVCGPGPFMDVVEQTLLARGVAAERIHIERFTPAGAPPVVADAVVGDAAPTAVTVELDGKVGTADHRPGTTILQMARQLGMSPPFSCESGSCATCMARLVEGEVTMRTNNALTPDEVDEGWILTCQSVPSGPSVRVVYED